MGRMAGVVESKQGQEAIGGHRERVAGLSQRLGLMPLARALRQVLKQDVRILAYHRVLDSVEPEGFAFDAELISASADMFRQQMALLRRRFHPLRFSELLDCIDAGRAVPPRSVLVTFDDGYDDNYRVAWPILRDLDMSAMFFVSTGHIDTGLPYAYDWLAHMLCSMPAGELSLPEIGLQTQLAGPGPSRRALVAAVLDRAKALDAATQEALITRLEEQLAMPREGGDDNCRPMTWEQLRQMRESGMEVGSHGVSHRMLAKLPRAQMRAELVDSRQALARELGIQAQVLSFPVGGRDAFNDEVIEAARDAGYRMACSYLAGTSTLAQAHHFRMARLPVERQMGMAWFEAMLSVPEVFSYTSRSRKA